MLGVTNGAISKYENQDIFIVACGLYAEKYGEECINPIVDCIEDEHDFDDLVRSFIMSFRWRKSKSIDGSSFMDMARNLRADPEILFRVLIECSTKKGHPLNADMLHSVLLPMRLSQRDYVWTIYINGLSYDEERVFQLIDQFDHGDMLDGLSEDNTHLLLILFTWLLTSSNRHLRDIASKGSIELLKNKFSLCLPLLQKFETVNDPYVIQRLFGVIFGACMKRVNKERGHFRELVDHIYQTIFNQDNVYPDVMLRDYARLIIERWIYEYPDDCEFIDQTMIVPPYRSTAIPTVEKQTYYQQGEKHRGFNAIDNSMTINHKECPGMYGDFGRYTFQAALESFKDVDVVEMYHYAMQYIRDELGYDEELFGNYDTYFLGRSYNRHANRKVERIGKKYQWIALYNVLARVSDVYQLSRWDEEPRRFEGPWNPYIRDFDPTLNRHFLRSDILPGFNYPQLSEELFLEIEPLPNKRTISEWNHGDTMFYSSLNSKLMFNDKEGNTWIALKLYECVKNKHHDIDGHSIGFTKGSQEIWHMEHGLFMRKGEFEENKQYLKKINFTGRHFPEGSDVYQLFNREYAWSSGMEDVFGTYWFDHEIEVGEKRKEKQIRKMPDFVYHENGDITIAYKDVECEIDVPEEIVTLHVLPAYSRVLWEAEYDASQEETTSFDIPCKQIINCLKLEQRKFDGYFHSADGDLVCFDSNLCGPCDGLIIRKDYLDRFLEKNDLALFWTSIGEKQFFLGDHAQSWGEWSGFFQYDGKQVIGCLECMNPQMK